MPKLVCVNCQTELRPFHNETLVIETASFGAYKVWFADTWRCEGCGVEIVAGFGDNPIRSDHYAPDFKDWLKNMMLTYKHFVYDNEKPKGESNDYTK